MRWIANPLNSAKARILEAGLHESSLRVSPSALPVLADLLVGRGILDERAVEQGDLNLLIGLPAQ